MQFWLDDFQGDESETIAVLAATTGISLNYIHLILTGKRTTISFDAADKILCGINMPFAWREPDLLPLYLELDLDGPAVERLQPPHRCARPGCSKIFPAGRYADRKKYCSRKCKGQASQARTRGFRSQLSRKYDRCPAGHDRSPENVREYVHRKTGQVEHRCIICERQRKHARKAAA